MPLTGRDDHKEIVGFSSLVKTRKSSQFTKAVECCLNWISAQLVQVLQFLQAFLFTEKLMYISFFSNGGELGKPVRKAGSSSALPDTTTTMRFRGVERLYRFIDEECFRSTCQMRSAIGPRKLSWSQL
jgi:hypothetical protein